MAIDLTKINFVNPQKDPNAYKPSVTPTVPVKTPTTRPTTPVPTTIAVDNLQTTPTLNYTPPKVNNAPKNNLANIVEETTAITTPTAPVKSQRDILIDEFIKLRQSQGDKASDTLKEQEDVQLAAKREALQRSDEALLRLSQSYEKEVERIKKNPDGKLAAALQGELSDAESRYLDKKADLAIDRLANQGDVDTALKIVEDKINAKYQPIQDQIDSAKELIGLYANDLSESEKVQLQQVWQEKQDTKNFEQQKELASYQSRLRREEDAYSASLKPTEGTAPKVVSVNGVDSVWDGTKFVPITLGAGGNTLQLASAESNINSIKSVTNSVAVRNVVGPTFLQRVVGRGFDSLTGERQNLIANIEQIRSQLTLDSLIGAKEKGATFGALSEGELRLLSQSGSKLGTWAVEDKQGRVVGYSASEKSFKEEMDKIKNFAALDYIIKGGTPENVGAITMPDGTIWIENSTGTLTKLK